MSNIASIRILVRFDFPGTTVRLWQGSGPYIDTDGEVWGECGFSDTALDQIELAINAEAYTLELALSGIDPKIADIAWKEYEANQVIDSKVQILLQTCDEYHQPIDDFDVVFTGTLDNLRFNDAVADSTIESEIVAEITNRFTLRTLTNGAVLSDVDQRARAKVLNSSAPSDRFCERMPGLADKTINWPNW